MATICPFPHGSCKTCHLFKRDEDRDRMACFYQVYHENPSSLADGGVRLVAVIRAGKTDKEQVPFATIQAGDTFFVNGHPLKTPLRAEMTPKGFLVYDQQLNTWYPEELNA